MQTFQKPRSVISLTGKRFSKLILVACLIVGGLSCQTIAQELSDRTITINMGASEMLPADLIIFNVNINTEGETPQEAYEIHKKQESLLADLLKDFEIQEENIDYEPIRMNKRYRDDRMLTGTNQSVSLSFSDFSIYEKIQVTLIENGFDSFNGQFSSTEINSGKERALIKAIEAAKERATLIAETVGVSIGDVQTINYSDYQINRPRVSADMAMMSSTRESSMMDFGQTVAVSANINISFTIE